MDRIERREDRNKRIKRQRRLTVAGVLAVAVIVVSLIVISGSSNHKNRQAKGSHPTQSKKAGSKSTSPVTLKSGSLKNSPVPILMYHVTAGPPAGAKYPDLYVSGADFDAQMQKLKQLGYNGVTLDQVYKSWHGGAGLPTKPIVVSFDDGYQSQYKNALPALDKVGWPGVMNLELNNLKQQWGLKPNMVKAMIASKWEIDSHTINHPDLTTVSPSTLKFELQQSRKIIKQKFGVPVLFFCYPAGKYNDTVAAAVKQAGYLGATTVDSGIASPQSDPYQLPRIRINGSDGVSGVLSKL